MKYAIQYQRMHDGTTNLLIYNKKKQAENNYTMIEDLLKNVDNEKATQNDYDFVMEDIFNDAIDVQEVDYRTLTEVIKDFGYQINNNGYVSTIIENVRIINFNQSVCLYV